MKPLGWNDAGDGDGAYSTPTVSGYEIDIHSRDYSEPSHPVIQYYAMGPQGDVLGIFHSVKAAKRFCETHYWLMRLEGEKG
jgi:hypothetical protein